MSKKDGGASKQAAATRAEEAQRQAEIRAGTGRINETFGQFDDGYFTKQRQNYLDFALPQLDDQYGKAQKELTFALARGGNLDGSARSSQFGELQKAYDTNRTTIADQGQTFANQARTQVEDARSNLIATLNATGDASGAANGAISRAAALAQPAGYSPIGDAFSSITGALSAQAAAERAQALSGGTFTAPYNLFGSGKSSVKVSG